MKPFAARILGPAVLVLLLLAGCATRPPADDPEALQEFRDNNDPFEPANRALFEVNEVIDKAVLQPIAEAYRDLLPKPVRSGIRNVLGNLRTPTILTGDLLRQDEDGYYTIVGRKKDMIRRNAENVAAREVEAVLRGLPQVKEAAVVPVPDERVGEEIKAYLQLQPGLGRDDLPPQRVIEHCKANLASFKIPRYIAFAETFPMTDSDRVEKKKLIAGVPDLTRDSYDRVDNIWR